MLLRKMGFRLPVIVVIAALVEYTLGKGGPKGEYSDEWLLKTADISMDVRNLMGKYGFEVVSEPRPGYFVLKETGATPSHMDPVVIRRDKALVENKIEYLQHMKYLDRRPRRNVARETGDFNVTDSNWDQMWHIKEDQFPSMHVYDVWKMGHAGAGIHSTILDDGVEPTHLDLIGNYRPEYSIDLIYDQAFVNHTEDDFHGTWCAGVLAAVKNDVCVVGVAYESSFSAVKIFDSYWGLNDAGEAMALEHALEQTDIYSNSWGPSDFGDIFEGPGPLTMDAITNGITNGRGGRGALYSWASGNGGPDDDCNCDGYANSIYTIAVTAVGTDQQPTWYAESCSSNFVATYAGVATTDTGNGCYPTFHGTSATCPMASGMMALTLEVRPELTWRDMQHLIAETATKDGLIRGDWQTNGAGKRVSHAYGFGLMNAKAMVEAAPTWPHVPEQVTCEGQEVIVNSVSDTAVSITSVAVSEGCGIRYLEHVQVWLSFHSEYRGTVELILTSPHGTESKLLHERPVDYYNGTTVWTFMTVMSWGEHPAGHWTLRLDGFRSGIVNGINSWKLIQYGTVDDPIFGASVGEDDSDSDAKTWGIVGGVVGGVVLFGAVAAVAYFLFLRKPKDPAVYPTAQSIDNN